MTVELFGRGQYVLHALSVILPAALVFCEICHPEPGTKQGMLFSYLAREHHAWLHAAPADPGIAADS